MKKEIVEFVTTGQMPSMSSTQNRTWEVYRVDAVNQTTRVEMGTQSTHHDGFHGGATEKPERK